MTTIDKRPENAGQGAKPWHAHYEPDVPYELTYEPRCLHEALPEAARRHPDRDALLLAVATPARLFTSTMTFARLDALVTRFAASLQRLGVEKGDRVAQILPNCPQFVIAFHAALRVGAVVVPFNPVYSARETEHQLADCGAKVVVVLSQFYATVKQVQGRTAVEKVIVTRIKEYFPALLWLLFTLTKERKLPRADVAPGDLWFSSLLGPGTPAPVPVSQEETALLLYTGGTTGISKGAELSHRNLVVNTEQCRVWAKIGDGSELVLAALPLFHAFGLTCGLNLSILTGGTLVLIPNPMDIPGLVLAIHRLRPTVFPAVPTLLVAITNLPGVESFDLKSIRVCPCAGSALAPAVQRGFEERTGVKAVQGYGLSEASPVTHGNPVHGENRSGTIGLPWPDTDARVVDLATGKNDVTFSEGEEWSGPGELLIRGPQVMKGYWNRPEATAEQIRNGWLHTGDIAQLHRDGYFRIVDRKKDMIIRGGLNVYPADLEAVLLEHPKVLEALVVGVPDDVRGELVKAFLVPRAGESLSPEEILDYCRENMAKYKVPSEVEVRESLPKSAVGKPLRRALREEALTKAKSG